MLGVSSLRQFKALFGEDALNELGLYYPQHLTSRCFEREVVRTITYATLPRKRLDDWLLARCVDAGVSLRDMIRLEAIDMQGHLATCVDRRSGETVQIGYGSLIGADGATSAVRHLATGRNQHIVPSLEGYVPMAGSGIVCEYHPAYNGYCWYIPAGEGANVGCMLHGGTAKECRTWLAAFSEELGLCLPKLRGAPIPAGDDVLLQAGTDVWLIGDAAGLILPIYGGGIEHAFISARVLATSLLGGAPYKEEMQPLLKRMEKDSARLGS